MRLRRSSIHRIVTPNSQSDWLFVIPGLLLVLLLGLPLLALFLRAAGGDFFGYALSETALSALQLSLVTSLISLTISLLIGTPLAYILARWEFPGRAALELLLDLPVVLPPSVAGLALLIAFGRRGLFGGWLDALGIQLPFTTAAVVIAQTFVSAPLFVRSARIGFASIDPQLEEAAHVEGATQVQMFTLVMFPLAGRALISGAILAWTRALGEFGATILFAGNLEGVTQTMPLAIYLSFERNLDVAVVLSVVLVLVSLILLGVMRKLDESQQHH
ncbi:MAG: ABC transporter permease [Chloroflexi bacterium]|nr:ABC transporter permease [Chloroflexota bacterium]